MKLDKKLVLGLAGTLVGLAGTMHLIRTLMQWPMVIGTYAIPYWFSIIAGTFALYISYELFMLRKKK